MEKMYENWAELYPPSFLCELPLRKMGKDIKGKELGKGLPQRKDDKRYVANFYQKDGTRRSQTFSTLQQGVS